MVFKAFLIYIFRHRSNSGIIEYFLNSIILLLNIPFSIIFFLPSRFMILLNSFQINKIPNSNFLVKIGWTLTNLVINILLLLGIYDLIEFLFQILKFNSRKLTPTEINEARKVFGDSIDYWKIRIDENSILARIGAKYSNQKHLGVVVFNSINFTKKINENDIDWLIHELTHIKQMQKIGPNYIFLALHAQHNEGYDYNKKTIINNSLKNYNFEQQAEIAKDYYSLLKNGIDHSNYNHLIAQLRNGDFI